MFSEQGEVFYIPAAFCNMVTRFIDLHEDFGITSGMHDVFSETSESSIEMLSQFEEAIIYSVVFPLTKKWVRKSVEKGYSLADRNYYYPDQHSLYRQLKFYQALEREGQVKIVRKKTDLEGKGVKFLMAMEGTDTIYGSEDVYFLRENGLRSIGLTWNHETKFAASCTSSKDYGLTGSGEELVSLCNELHMGIDLGHASDQTIIDAAQASKHPVVVSHTNPKSYHNIFRNMSDEAIEAVAKNKGIIGLTSISATLGEAPTIDNLVESINYVGENYGWQLPALGTDFLGMPSTLKGLHSLKDLHSLEEKLGQHADQVLWKNAFNAISGILE